MTGSTIETSQTAGVILAGGRSSRMGGQSKALLPLNNEALLTHVIRRLQPQLGSLLLSTGGPADQLESYALPLVPDLLPRHRGPLTGLCSALQYLNDQNYTDRGYADRGWNGSLVLCPCDAPFIPSDLVEKLLHAAVGSPKPVVVASYEGFLQPTFSLWQRHHLAVIHDAVMKRGDGGLKYMLRLLPHVVVEWVSAEPPPFYNVNTPRELQTAQQWLAARSD